MKKGFTLLELLIVIGILAILSTTMILVINPAEMLKKARDSQRISDLNTLKTAISMYLTDVASPTIGTSTYSYSHVTSVNCGATGNASTSQAVNGNGWIPINFTSITGGAPISALPVDPNPTAYATSPYLYYAYVVGSSNTFKIFANMESTYYSYGGTGSIEDKDGGTKSSLYEVGTDLSIGTTSASCYNSAS
ncbi:MAG: type II secretion system protein [Parcubacteria group bacterium]|nr:type II secretion system protein [Parcubacteria group bacterium]